MAVETQAAPETLDELLTIFPYKDWQAREGLPVVTGYYVEDLGTLELGDWPSREARGAFVNLEGTGGVNDLQLLEVPPGGISTICRSLTPPVPSRLTNAPRASRLGQSPSSRVSRSST